MEKFTSLLPFGAHSLTLKWMESKPTRKDFVMQVALAALTAYGSYRFKHGHLVIGFSSLALSKGLKAEYKIRLLNPKIEMNVNHQDCIPIKMLSILILSSYVGHSIRSSFFKQIPMSHSPRVIFVTSVFHFYLHFGVIDGLSHFAPMLCGRFSSNESSPSPVQIKITMLAIGLFAASMTFIAPRLSFLRGVLIVSMFYEAIKGGITSQCNLGEMRHIFRLALILWGAGLAGRMMRSLIGPKNFTPARSLLSSVISLPIHMLNLNIFFILIATLKVTNYDYGTFIKNLLWNAGDKLFLDLFDKFLSSCAPFKVEYLNKTFKLWVEIFEHKITIPSDELSTLVVGYSNMVQENGSIIIQEMMKAYNFLGLISRKDLDAMLTDNDIRFLQILQNIEAKISKLLIDFQYFTIVSLVHSLKKEDSMTEEEIKVYLRDALEPSYKIFYKHYIRTPPPTDGPIRERILVATKLSIDADQRGEKKEEYRKELLNRLKQLFPVKSGSWTKKEALQGEWTKKKALYFLLAFQSSADQEAKESERLASQNYKKLALWFHTDKSEADDQGDSHEDGLDLALTDEEAMKALNQAHSFFK